MVSTLSCRLGFIVVATLYRCQGKRLAGIGLAFPPKFNLNLQLRFVLSLVCYGPQYRALRSNNQPTDMIVLGTNGN
jgi:hypothetical protein